jgi:hypothetical protein
MGCGDGLDDIEDAPGAFLVDQGEVEVAAAGVLGLLVIARELAREKAAGERAPDEQAGLFSFEQGDDVTLEIAAGDGVVRLQGVEPGEVAELGDVRALAIFQESQLETPM